MPALIDEARVPLVIAGHESDQDAIVYPVDRLVRRFRPFSHYSLDEYSRNVTLTDAGIEAVERAFNCGYASLDPRRGVTASGGGGSRPQRSCPARRHVDVRDYRPARWQHFGRAHRSRHGAKVPAVVCLMNLESRISNLKSQISNLESEISNSPFGLPQISPVSRPPAVS